MKKPSFQTLLILILAGALLASCSASNQLKRANRLIAKAEANGAKWSETSKTDTVFVIKEVSVPGVEVDTVANLTADTIIVTKDIVITKVVVDTRTKKVYVKTTVKPDTIKVRTYYTITKTVSKQLKAGYSLLQLIGMGIFGIILGAFLGRLFWR